MAGLSGLVKKISDLVAGTPADDDCFIFGKSDLKKITLEDLKESLGINALNSALSRIIVADITNATFKYNNEDNLNRFEIVYGLQNGCIVLLWWDGVNIAYDFYDGTKWNRIWTK